MDRAEDGALMKLIVAGRDRAADLGARLAAEGRALEADGRGASRYGPADSALTLRDARDEGAYLRELIRLVRLRSSVALSSAPWPARPGFFGRAAASLRGVLWRILRYQHERTAAELNGVLRMHADALAFQQARIDALERAQAAPAAARGAGGAAP